MEYIMEYFSVTYGKLNTATWNLSQHPTVWMYSAETKIVGLALFKVRFPKTGS